MLDYLKGFETERLIVRKLTRQDIPVWAEFFLDKRPFEYIGLEDNMSPCDHSEAWMKRQFKRYKDGEYGLMALIEKETMKFIGQCGLITMNVKTDDELELGYHIIEQHRGKGYATEAIIAFINYTFGKELCKSLIAVVNTKNEVSEKVSKKLGFKKDGEIICMNKPAILYRLKPEDWGGVNLK